METYKTRTLDTDPFLTCTICLEVAKSAVEAECCHGIYCQQCAQSLSNRSCPGCRSTPFRWKDSYLARRMISSIPVECPQCKETTSLGELDSHGYHCSKAIRQCKMNNCNFAASTDVFFAHIIERHKKDLLEAFDKNTACTSEPEKLSTSIRTDDLIKIVTNSAGRQARLGVTGKYYCGGRLEGICYCCDGNCGLGNGCNCKACMMLDIQMKRLPKGYWVNREGAVCRRGVTNKVYCGRNIDVSYPGGYCGPNDGNNCQACKILETQLRSRYHNLN